EIGKSILEVVGDGDVICTGAGTTVVVDQDAAETARAVGQHATDPAFLAKAVLALASMGEGLPSAPTAAAAAELGARILGEALAATRVQILRDSDGDKGQGYAVLAGISSEEGAPVGVVQVERSLLVKVAEQDRAIAAFDGERVAVLAPLKV